MLPRRRCTTGSSTSPPPCRTPTPTPAGPLSPHSSSRPWRRSSRSVARVIAERSWLASPRRCSSRAARSRWFATVATRHKERASVPASRPRRSCGGGPHVHRPFVGPPAVPGPGPSHPVSDHHDGETTTGNHPLSPGSSGETSSGSTHHGNTHSFHHDAADDTDHGTGNDGSHDDNG